MRSIDGSRDEAVRAFTLPLRFPARLYLSSGNKQKTLDFLIKPFNPLPMVISELNGIVKDPEVKGANGVLPGAILVNGQFTEKAMEN